MKKTILTKSLKLHVFPLVSVGLLSLVCTLPTLGTGCVTVNVNFPESAAQKATDDYVRDLYRAKERGKPAAASSTTSSWVRALFISEAHAADDSFTVSSPKAEAIKVKLKARVDEVIEQKKAGVLGESNDGKLVLKDASKLKKLLQTKVENLVKAENADRTELYKEVLSANKLPATKLKNIETSFSRSFQAESPSGTWLESADGVWSQKP